MWGVLIVDNIDRLVLREESLLGCWFAMRMQDVFAVSKSIAVKAHRAGAFFYSRGWASCDSLALRWRPLMRCEVSLLEDFPNADFCAKLFVVVCCGFSLDEI